MSFQHIVVGTDFSAPSERAVRVAASLAERSGARLTLLHVYDPSPISPVVTYPTSALSGADLGKQLEADARKNLDEAVKTVDMDGEATAALVADRHAAAATCSFAGEHGADLLVVGSHGRTGLQRFLIGSVAEKVLRHAPCPTLVVRAQPAPASFPARVHVCTDFSATAAAGIELAKDLVAAFGSKVRLVHAEDPSSLDSTVEREVTAERRGELETLHRLHFAGEPAADVVLGQDVADAIVTHARQTEPDALVLASHGKGMIEKLLVGSVTERVARHAPCSVFVAKV